MEIKIEEKEAMKIKKVVGTQISQNMYEQLKNEAEEAFMSISDLLRKIIFLYYKNAEIRKEKNNG